MKTVLTIADSKVVRSMVVRGLAAFSCTLIEAGSGGEGVEAARRHRPDLVLLDATLPAVDGRPALAVLRGDSATAGIPVILLTNDETVDAVGLGAVGAVVKPFQVATLEREVRKVLGAPGADASTESAAAPRGGAA
jgi:CheY-like chemotaxis protein